MNNKKTKKIIMWILGVLSLAIIAPFLLFFVLSIGHVDYYYPDRGTHQNAAEQLFTATQAYLADVREYPLVTDWRDSLGECLGNSPCLNSYLSLAEFNGGTDTTFYYWTNKEASLVCVSEVNDKPEKYSDYYCTGNGFEQPGVPGSISSKDVDEEDFPINGNWTLIQDWNGDIKQFGEPYTK